MKAAHWSAVLLLLMFGVLVEQSGIAMQGKAMDMLAIGSSVAGIIAAFLPSVLLIFRSFVPARNPLDMPVSIADIKAGNVPNPTAPEPTIVVPYTNAGNTSKHWEEKRASVLEARWKGEKP